MSGLLVCRLAVPRRADVDECVKPETQCPGPCINLPGTFRCDCDVPGFIGTHSMQHCKDVDECAVDNGGCDDLCINKFGSFECRCETKGRKLAADGRSCVDVDECARYKGKVCTNGHCLNTDGSYMCTCNKGFRLMGRLDSCHDINECAHNNGGCSQLCHNSPGSFRCSCEEGFSLTEDKSICRDINECVTKRGGCQDVCVNTLGSFKCLCTHVGQVLSEDGLTCKGCTSRQFFNRSTSSCASCPSHAHARDGLALSVQDCRCDQGFHGNPGLGVQCQDTNECHTGHLNCSHHCVNTEGSAHCACPDGFKVDNDGVTCRDINECRLMTHDCSQICDNTEGSFSCRCFSGYLITDDKRTCTDVDECATGLATCSHQCLNTDGGYSCTCQKGYQLSSNYIDCTDVDECQLQVSPCQHTCTNTVGSYTCQCDGPGFKLSRDLSSCLDINECMEGDNPCPDICVNTEGSYSCDCNTPGYHLVANSSVCQDLDECSQTPSPCSHTCENTPGSFRCVCPAGYDLTPDTNSSVCRVCGYGTYRGEQDGGCRRCPPRTNTTQTGSTSIKVCLCRDGFREDPGGSGLCIDVDECKLGLLTCQQECVNTDGTARCDCHPGFVLHADKTSCTDINECAVQRGGCAHKCVNTLGSFQCVCNKNYRLAENGLSCEDVDGCDQETYECEYKCVMTKGGPSCVCQPGYELLEDGKKCSDVDECQTRKGGCTDTCINTPGSFRCECNIPGYTLFKDGKQCVDVNECEVDGACEDVCVNSIGSFKCYCRKQGFALAHDKRHCEDIDECAKPRVCQHTCTNLPGSFRCDCDPGYFKHGHNCVPCDKGSYRGWKHPDQRCQLCPPGMTTSREATETVRGCFCLSGYYGNPDLNETCKDVDECEKNHGGCDQVCSNTDGSFHCSCKFGYALQADNKTCLPTKCPLLELPKYTKFTTPECEAMSQGHHVTPGTTCSVKCKGSFLLLGSESRTCLSNFTWTGSKPNCTGAFTCDRLPLPENGFLEPPLCMLPSVPFRTRCHIRCSNGYKLQGRMASKCRAFNQWSGKLTYKCIKRKYVKEN